MEERMELKAMKKVVIITEAAIKNELLDLLHSLGAKGYTIDTVSGSGERGIRDEGELVLGDYLRNIKVEIITTENVAERIMSFVEKTFFDNYAGITYASDVMVVRAEKFG
jgi:nitrogen regulatory protein PII